MNQELTIAPQDVSPVVARANALQITNEEGVREATEVLSNLNVWLDKVEEDRIRITKPLNDALREINGRYKPLKELLEGAVKGLRGKMGEYATKALEERKKAELKLAEKVAGGTMKMETAVAKLDEMQTIEKRVDGESGSVSFIEVEKFEVVDFAKLPDDYKLVNEKALRDALKEGVKVEGVRYWKEQSVRNRR